jgi:hypothetical protein
MDGVQGSLTATLDSENPISIDVANERSEYGAAFVSHFENGERVPLVNSLTVEPTGQDACNADPAYASCLGDGKLAIESNWDTAGAVGFNDPGYTLSPGSFISSNPPLNLDAGRLPRLVVNARAVGQSGTLEVRLGRTSQTFTLSGEAQNYTIAAAAHESDAGVFYTIVAQNAGTSAIELQSMCVQFTQDSGGDPTDPPPPRPDDPAAATCQFVNSSFDSGVASWTVEPGVESGDGSLNLPGAGSISQSITLAAGTYTLNIVASVWAYSSYTPNDESTVTGITLEYAYPSPYVTIAGKTWGDFGGAPSGTVVYSSTFTLTASTSGAFSIRAIVDNPPTGVRGVMLRSACIISSTQGGGEPPDAGEVSGGIFRPICGRIPVPVGNSISAWMSWHWANLNSFFQCDLMRLLNQMYRLAMQQYQLFRWSLLYNQAVVEGYWRWATADVFPWLGGHFSNIATGQQTFVEVDSQEQCGNIFCLISNLGSGAFDFLGSFVDHLVGLIRTTLEELFIPLITAVMDFLSQAFTFLFNLGRDLIDLFFRVIGLIVDAFEMIGSLLQSIAIGWNSAPPADLPFAPNCRTEPQKNGVCIVLWMLENTVFSRTGALWIPIIIGVSSAFWLLWAISTIKKTLFEAGKLL